MNPDHSNRVDLPVIRTEHRDVNRRLGELGLDLAEIQEVVEFARIHWAATTSDYPRVFPGMEFWGHAVGQWRARLGARGWSKRDDNNYPIAIHPNGNWAVTVEGGTRSTGVPSETPTSRNRKGKSTAKAVAQNQLSFWDVQPDLAPLPRETWILLLHLDKASYKARAELSLPLGLDQGLRASHWAERIIIPRDDERHVVPNSSAPGIHAQPTSDGGATLIRRID